MRALLIISHGSRRAASNDEVRQLASNLAAECTTIFDRVVCSFLELSTPSVADAFADLYRQGVRRITVFPHFLAAGTHVTNDIPRLIETSTQLLPELQIEVMPHMGALNGLSSIILNAVKQADS